MSWEVVQSMKHPIKTDITQVLSEQIWFGMAWHQIPSVSLFLLSGQWRPSSWKWAQSSVSWMRHDRKIWFVCALFSSLLSQLSRKRYQSLSALCEAAQPVHSAEHWDGCSPVFISTRLSSDGELRHQRWKHKHGPGPWSHSQWDSPGNKIWWTVSNFLLRRAKCNHSARCSDARSSVVLYCTYLVCARSGNPTKWLCCTTARDTSPNHKHGQMTAWK